MRYQVTIKYKTRITTAFPWTEHEITLKNVTFRRDDMITDVHTACYREIQRKIGLSVSEFQLISITLTLARD